MKKELLKSLLALAGALLFNILFWQEKMGLNLLLFDAFILWSVFYLYPSSFSRTTVKWLTATHLVTLATVIIHNTLLSKLAYSITLMTLVVFIQYAHRSVWYAAGSALMNCLMVVPSFADGIRLVKVKSVRFYSVNRVIRVLIIPVILVAVFLVLYASSNAVFDSLLQNIGTVLQDLFAHLFDWFNWERFWFIVLGLLITGVLLLKSNSVLFSVKDVSRHDDLHRSKRAFGSWKDSVGSDLLSLLMGKFSYGNMALKNEYSVGIISMALLNILLLCINCIDIKYVWFGFQFNNAMHLSAFVHEGTWLLIVSIVLAMLILLFFFRGNLNFYKQNKWLRIGAYSWIVQNIILVISVLIRDYYYIAHKGLAYKRIGVLFFLLLVLAGLVTVFLKIYRQRTTYYLLRINAWFAMVLLVLASGVHWDAMIADYNLAHKDSIPLDMNFLLSLSDRTLPAIEANSYVLDNAKYRLPDSTADHDPDKAGLTDQEYFEDRKQSFFREQQCYSWLSWNLSDAYVKEHLHPAVITSSTNK
jgi:hypothetical protein